MRRELIERKLKFLHGYIVDLERYLPASPAEREADHYAIERILQLMCESAADITLQLLRGRGTMPPESYRGVFEAAETDLSMPTSMAKSLALACGMRNVIVHLYDELDMDMVFAAVDQAPTLYREFGAWVLDQLP